MLMRYPMCSLFRKLEGASHQDLGSQDLAGFSLVSRASTKHSLLFLYI